MTDPTTAASTDSGLTALSMLDRVRSADPEAWRRLVHLYSPLIFSWCRRAEVASEDAADLMQEVWGSVSANIGRFERSTEFGSFRGWLWTITRNKLRDFWRSRSNQTTAVGGSEIQARLSMIPDHEPAGDTESDSTSLMHRALQMIRIDFEPRTWSAFWRTAVDGVSAAVAGKELGLTVDAVYQAKSRVLRRLREEMQGLVQ